MRSGHPASLLRFLRSPARRRQPRPQHSLPEQPSSPWPSLRHPKELPGNRHPIHSLCNLLFI